MAYLDAAGRRHHNERSFQWAVAGQDPNEYPDYVPPGEGELWDDADDGWEAELKRSPLVRRVPAPE
jgi:hypothetical protein